MKGFLLVGVAASAFTFTSPAQAQDVSQPGGATEQTATRTEAPDTDGGELVVTAQRRAENIQDVPISVSAFNAETLESANIQTVFDLPRLAPSLQLDTGIQAAKARLVIRGIGSAGGSSIEPSVATFIDGVYVPREGATIAAYLDLAGLEVLRGPQGTLFGRNASVGALNLRSALPERDFSGQVTAEAGTGDRYRLEGHVNVPLGEAGGLRFAGYAQTMEGLYYNRLTNSTVGGSDSFAARLTGAFDLSERVAWVVRVNYASREGDAFVPYALLPDTFPAGGLQTYLARLALIGSTDVDLEPFDRTINQYVGDDLKDSQWGVTSTLDFEAGSGFTLRLINAYQDWTSDQYGTGAFSAEVPMLDQFVYWGSESHSHELQLISPQNELLGGRFDFVAGLYFFQENYAYGEAFRFREAMCRSVFVNLAAPLFNSCLANANSRAFDTVFDQDTTSYAAYAQATYRITDTIDVVLGGRFTRDEKDASISQVVYAPIGGLAATNEDRDYEVNNSRFTWRANVNWRPNDDILVFGSYSTGYKSGGVNSQTSGALVERVFRPETVESWELGIKSDWFDRLLQVNATLYQMDVSDFQDRAYNSINFSLQNAGDIRNRGVELEVALRPAQGLRLNAAVSYLDSEFTSYPGASNLPGLPGVRDISGTRPAFAPEWAGAIGGEYRSNIGDGPLSFMVRADMSFVGDTNIGYVNDANPLTVQDAYQLVSARAVLYGAEEKWAISVFADNIFDVGYCTSLPYQPFGGLLGAVAGGQSALRCNTVGTPQTIGVSGTIKF